MKLNRESKEELRLELDKALDKIKFDPNNRINKFSKNDLEMLLFDYDPETNQKIVGWHSKNLKKLDLSKVSFKGIYFGDDAEKDFSDTNIKFNIMDCAIIKTGCVDGSCCYDLDICNAKFDNVNLSRNSFNAIGIDFSDIFTVGLKNCSFKNTGLKIQGGASQANYKILFKNCDLSKIDLSKIKMEYISGYNAPGLGNFRFIFPINFKNTGITLKLTGKFEKENLKRMFSDDRLGGCFIVKNDKTFYMKTKEERKKEARKILKEYNSFIDNKIESIKSIVSDAIMHRYDSYPYKPIEYQDDSDLFTINKESMDRIRREVAKMLEHEHYDKDYRIKLDSYLLNMLLFNYKYDEFDDIYEEIGFKHRSIDRLDLSNADFDNVSFDCSNIKCEDGSNIFLGGTNARIDFRKSTQYQDNSKIIVKDIDLGGVDLSNNALENEDSTFENCDLSYTGLKIKKLQLKDDVGYAKFINCNLTGLDLSNVLISTNGQGYRLYIIDCNVRDTKLRFANRSCDINPNDLHKIFNDEKYIGCYVNGVKVLSSYEQIKAKEKAQKEYEKFAANKKKKLLQFVQDAANNNKNQGEQ